MAMKDPFCLDCEQSLSSSSSVTRAMDLASGEAARRGKRGRGGKEEEILCAFDLRKKGRLLAVYVLSEF